MTYQEKIDSYTAKMFGGGKVVIPAPLRKQLNLKAGDRVLMDLEDGKIVLRSQAQAIRDAQAWVRSFVPEEVSLVDELIAERRGESERE